MAIQLERDEDNQDPVLRAGDATPGVTGDATAGTSVLRVVRSPAQAWRGAKGILFVADTVMAVVALVAAFSWYRAVPGPHPRPVLTEYVRLGLITLPIWPVCFCRNRLYAARFVTRRAEEYRRIVRAVIAAIVAMTFTATFLKLDVARTWLVAVAVTALVLLCVERDIARRIFARQRAKGRLLRRVVVVGGNAEGTELCSMLSADPTLGYQIVGIVDDNSLNNGSGATSRSVLGTIEQTMEVVRRAGANGVIIAATAIDLAASNRLIRQLTDAGIHVELSSTLLDIASNRLTVRPLGRFPVVYVEPVMRRGWRPVAKRCFDLVLASFGLVLVSPVLLVSAIAIKLDSPGPILFRQQRVGRNGKRFWCLKLRTMVSDAEAKIDDLRHRNEADGPLFKIKDDPRVTRIGRFLRKSSIDDPPQLWNVVKGEMSLVGPRPALPREVDAWAAALHQRLRVRPGITGMWQVNGRSRSRFEDYARLDLYYVDNWSLVTDLMIMVKTLPAVLARKGAM